MLFKHLSFLYDFLPSDSSGKDMGPAYSRESVCRLPPFVFNTASLCYLVFFFLYNSGHFFFLINVHNSMFMFSLMIPFNMEGSLWCL